MSGRGGSLSPVSPTEAREALLFHSGAHGDVDSPRWKYGFLGSLRPFSGLREQNFHEVMGALRVLAPALEGELIARDVTAALMGICHFGRAWGIHPSGMLRRNGLISDEDVERLESWVWTISYATTCVLDGAIDEAFHEYDQRRPAFP